MVKRNEEWEDRKLQFKRQKMAEFKDLLIELAMEEKREIDNKEKLAKVMADRSKRDAEIAAKKKEEGTADVQDERMAEGKKANTALEDNDWTRGVAVVREEPERSFRKDDEAGFGNLTRSSKPRAAMEESKGERPSFKNSKKEDGFGFDRANAPAKTEDASGLTRNAAPAKRDDPAAAGF